MRRFFAWMAIGMVCGLAALVTVPRAAGVTPFTVLTGSMRPSLGVGDVVLSARTSPLDARPGDVVTFHDPSRNGELVTHRVRTLRRNGSMVDFVTKGDANSVPERWSVPADGQIGRAVLHVPKVGYALHAAGSRQGRLGLIVAPAILLVLLELGGLLGLRREPQPEGAA